jgi:hypothetical protein
MTAKALTPVQEETAARIFDLALERSGMPDREDAETIDAYATRKDFGPNTQYSLARAAEHARAFDQGNASVNARSARDFHDDPAPPDVKTRKR